MKRALGFYQYAGPLVLLPTTYWLWWRYCSQSHAAVILFLSMPILFSYIVPAVGANVLGFWEIRTELRVGRIRPHHGFVFGSATSLFALICLDGEILTFTFFGCLRAGFLLGSVLAFWNWLYDIIAIESGVLAVYNRPYSRNQGAAAIATDYAPVIFGTFGACYGMALYVCRHYLLSRGQWELYPLLFVMCNLTVILSPVGAYILCSYLRTGEAGLTPYYRSEPELAGSAEDGEAKHECVGHSDEINRRDEP